MRKDTTKTSSSKAKETVRKKPETVVYWGAPRTYAYVSYVYEAWKEAYNELCAKIDAAYVAPSTQVYIVDFWKKINNLGDAMGMDESERLPLPDGVKENARRLVRSDEFSKKTNSND